MTLQELEYFYDLAQTLNFSITAERLYVTQPVVSKHIRLLEESLGFSLIDRSIRKRIRLTRSGEILFQCLGQCRYTWNTAIEQIREDLKTTQILYYLPEDQIPPKYIIDRFDAFRKQSSKNAPAFKVLERNTIKETLSDGGFVIIPDFLEISGHYNSLKIQTNTDDTLYLISSVSHPAAGKKLSDYAGSPLFLPVYFPQSAINYMSKVYSSAFGAAPEIVMLDNPSTVIMYLLADIGVTINTGWYAWLNDPRLNFLPLKKTVEYKILWDPETFHPEQALTMAKQLNTFTNPSARCSHKKV